MFCKRLRKLEIRSIYPGNNRKFLNLNFFIERINNFMDLWVERCLICYDNLLQFISISINYTSRDYLCSAHGVNNGMMEKLKRTSWFFRSSWSFTRRKFNIRWHIVLAFQMETNASSLIACKYEIHSYFWRELGKFIYHCYMYELLYLMTPTEIIMNIFVIHRSKIETM